MCCTAGSFPDTLVLHALMHALLTSLMLGHYPFLLHPQVTSCLLSLNGDDPAFSVARVAQVTQFARSTSQCTAAVLPCMV
jgi:hypothetical protein